MRGTVDGSSDGGASTQSEQSPSGSREAEVKIPSAEFIELDVPGFRPAVVSLPKDFRRPRPGLVAAHGAGDGPWWQCELWRELIGARGFVLCPAGVPFTKDPNTGYFFRNHYELEKEVLAAVEALRSAFPDELDPGPFVYTGYSQGATMGALMLVERGELFPRIALIEGGYAEWNVNIARKYLGSGGERVLFACGIRTCKTKADRSASWIEQGGLVARVEYAEGAGHTYGGAVAERVFHALDWLLEGDERWR